MYLCCLLVVTSCCCCKLLVLWLLLPVSDTPVSGLNIDELCCVWSYMLLIYLIHDYPKLLLFFFFYLLNVVKIYSNRQQIQLCMLSSIVQIIQEWNWDLVCEFKRQGIHVWILFNKKNNKIRELFEFIVIYLFFLHNSIVRNEGIWILDNSVRNTKRQQLRYKTLDNTREISVWKN